MRTWILRGLSSERLSCGCFVGVCETYAGETVRIVDAHDRLCTEFIHRDGAVMPDAEASATGAPRPAAPAREMVE